MGENVLILIDSLNQQIQARIDCIDEINKKYHKLLLYLKRLRKSDIESRRNKQRNTEEISHDDQLKDSGPAIKIQKSPDLVDGLDDILSLARDIRKTYCCATSKSQKATRNHAVNNSGRRRKFDAKEKNHVDPAQIKAMDKSSRRSRSGNDNSMSTEKGCDHSGSEQFSEATSKPSECLFENLTCLKKFRTGRAKFMKYPIVIDYQSILLARSKFLTSIAGRSTFVPSLLVDLLGHEYFDPEPDIYSGSLSDLDFANFTKLRQQRLLYEIELQKIIRRSSDFSEADIECMVSIWCQIKIIQKRCDYIHSFVDSSNLISEGSSILKQVNVVGNVNHTPETAVENQIDELVNSLLSDYPLCCPISSALEVCEDLKSSKTTMQLESAIHGAAARKRADWYEENNAAILEFHANFKSRICFCVESAMGKVLMKALLRKLRACCTNTALYHESSKTYSSSDSNIIVLRKQWIDALKEYQSFWTCVAEGSDSSPNRIFT